jgi:hypothetical protein
MCKTPYFWISIMITDQRTGTRSIAPARETFAAVALISLTLGTVLRCVDGRAGGAAGALLTIVALALVSRFRVSWDRLGIHYQTPLWSTRKRWTELFAYTIEPRHTDAFSAGPDGPPRRSSKSQQGCRLLLRGDSSALNISLRLYSYQDIRHLTDAVSTELPAHESSSLFVS